MRTLFARLLFGYCVCVNSCYDCQPAVNASVGSRVTIPCNSQEYYPQWRGPSLSGQDIIYNNQGTAVFNSILGEKKYRLYLENNRNLVIYNVTRTDGGLYTCSSMEPVLVTIRVRPDKLYIPRANISSDISVISGTEGIQLDLTCISSGGYPEQTVQWFKNNTLLSSVKSVTNDTVTNTFIITLVTEIIPRREDENATFVCISSFLDEPQLPVKTAAKLYVAVKPSMPVVFAPGLLKEGDNTTFARCMTYGFRPSEIKIYWVYRGEFISFEGSLFEDVPSRTFSASTQFQKVLTRKYNGQMLVCAVEHQTLFSSITANLSIQVQFKPLSTVITGNSNIVANGRNSLRLKCTSGTSNPVAEIVWKVNGVVVKNTSSVDRDAEFGGKQRESELILIPTRNNDNDIISCEAYNNVSGDVLVTSNCSLELKYSPIILTMVNVTVVEGNYTLLNCSAISKPPSTFTWYREALRLIQGNGTALNNRLLYNITYVNRNDTATYRCIANNGIEADDSKVTSLKVLYPPEVTVHSTNTSVKANRTALTCVAKGEPDTGYKYGKWTLEWPGYGVVYESYSGYQTLDINNLTYEHSGIYRCSASNGIKVFGTDQEYLTGAVFMLVKSFPIITRPRTAIEQIPGKLNSFALTIVEYYSNANTAHVTCFKVMNGTRLSDNMCVTQYKDATINLPVFTSIVQATGVLANISIKIDTVDDFGLYDVVIVNEVDAATMFLDIIPEGPPEAPHDLQVDEIKQTTVRLSWMPGFDGGFIQSFVIQLGADNVTWTNRTLINGINGKTRLSATLTGLDESRSYLLRMYAFNAEGSSDFTDVHTFTTLTKVEENKSNGGLVGGLVGGLTAVIVIVCVLVVIVLQRKGLFPFGKQKGRNREETNSGHGLSYVDEPGYYNLARTYENLNTSANVYESSDYGIIKDNQTMQNTSSEHYGTLNDKDNAAHTYSTLSKETESGPSDAVYMNTTSNKIYVNLKYS